MGHPAVELARGRQDDIDHLTGRHVHRGRGTEFDAIRQVDFHPHPVQDAVGGVLHRADKGVVRGLVGHDQPGPQAHLVEGLVQRQEIAGSFFRTSTAFAAAFAAGSVFAAAFSGGAFTALTGRTGHACSMFALFLLLDCDTAANSSCGQEDCHRHDQHSLAPGSWAIY